jgi:RES domain-containing protein
MLVYRITQTKYAGKLIASGRAARWNPNDIWMIYTACSRSLACLENAVRRSQAGLSALFSIMTIEVPDHIKIKTIPLNDLPVDWTDYNLMYVTQRIGGTWINEHETAILKIPSSVIEEEVNYLLNPDHRDFEQIKVIKIQPFVFDKRLKE